MRSSFLCIVILLLSAFVAQGQHSLSGYVMNADTKEFIPGALIYISDLKQSVYSDENGHYFFNGLPNGKFNVEAHLLGFAGLNQVIKVQGDTKVDLYLKSSEVELNEVVVTGVSHSTELKRSPVTAMVIDNTTLVQGSSTNIIDALASAPGISQISTGAGVSKPVIRGLSGNRIIVMHDGIRQEGQQWGEEHGIEIDEFSAQRVEILKGPASLFYGSDGIGGVINILSPIAPPEGSIKGKVTENFQTNNKLLGSSAFIEGNLKGINWSGRFSQKSAGNYQNSYDGRVANSGYREIDYSSLIGINKKWGYSHLSFAVFDQHLGIPEGERDSLGKFTHEVFRNDSILVETVPGSFLESRNLDIPNQHVQHYMMILSNNFQFGKSHLTFSLAYQENHRREYADIERPLVPGLSMKLGTWSYDLKYFLPQWKNWDFATGINVMTQKNANEGNEFLIPDYGMWDGGIFFFGKKQFSKKLNISGGLRYDLRQLNTKSLYVDTTQLFVALDTTYNSITGSIGAVYTYSEKLLFKFNVANGFRSPNLAELSANGVHEGTFRYETGNRKLAPEISFSEDLGMSYSSEHFALDISVFNNAINRYIYIQKVRSSNGGDSIPDPQAPSVLAYTYVQGNADLFGGEIQFDLHPHPLDWLHLGMNYSFVRGINLSQNTNLPSIPSPEVGGELKVSLKKAKGPFKNGYAEFDVEHHFPQNHPLREYNTETPTPSYTLVNAGLGTDITDKKGNTRFSLYFAGRNLANTSYQDHLSRLKYAPVNDLSGRRGIFNMGRNFSFKVVIPITLKSGK